MPKTPKSNAPELAVIIPAYRAGTLRKALGSLLNQRDKLFRVYVCDDGSPEDLSPVCAEFEDGLDLRYVRFSDNLGQTSLSEHLARCLEAIADEPLVCFLSDDNEWSRNAVGRIRKVVAKNPDFDVYHLETKVIDTKSNQVMPSRRFPKVLTVDKLFIRVFSKNEPAPLSGFIFRNGALKKAFVKDPPMYRNDLATILTASKEKGIRAIRRAFLLWRYHEDRIGEGSELRLRIDEGLCALLKWSETFFADAYPLVLGDALRLFGKYVSRLYPARSAAEVQQVFETFDACKGPIRHMRAMSVLKKCMKEREAAITGA